VVAGRVGCLVDAAAISIKFAIFPGNELSVVFGVEIDGALGGSGGEELGSLVEINLVLVREGRWGLCEAETADGEGK
jgi:hypothetical protein